MPPQTQRFAPQDLLVVNKARNLLICRYCGYGINPGAIAIESHFVRRHKGITGSERSMLKSEFGNLTTLSKTALLECASEEDRAVARAAQDLGFCEDLLPPIAGQRCTVEDTCRHCTTTSDSMRQHYTKAHPGMTGSCRPAQIQALFCARFFEVHPPANQPVKRGGEGEAALMAAYQKVLTDHSRELTRIVALKDRQPNMFERRMGWSALLEGQDLDELAKATSLEELDDDVHDQVHLQQVHQLAMELFKECHGELVSLETAGQGVVLRYLYSVNDRVSETVLHALTSEGGLDAYTKDWMSFVVFCCRSFRWTLEERRARKLVLPPRLERSLRALWDGLEGLNASPAITDQQAVREQLFDFLTAILGQRTGARVEENPLIYFLAVRAWERKQNRWKTPPEYSGILSHMVYGLRAIAARELAQQRRTSPRDADADFEFIKEYCRGRLVSGCGAVFDEVFNRRSYTMGVGASWLATPRVEWSRLRDSLSYTGHRIQIVDMKRMMSGLIESAEEWICNLMGVERDYLLRYDPAELTENMMWATAGDSIVNLNPKLQKGHEKMQARGPLCEAYWSNLGAKSHADREIGTVMPLSFSSLLVLFHFSLTSLSLWSVVKCTNRSYSTSTV